MLLDTDVIYLILPLTLLSVDSRLFIKEYYTNFCTFTEQSNINSVILGGHTAKPLFYRVNFVHLE